MSGRAELLFLAPVTPSTGGNGLAMRAGLFLEGLARRHSVRVLVVPVFGRPDPPDGFVRRHAAGFEVLDLTPPSDPLTGLTARLAPLTAGRRIEALHPVPALTGAATPAAAAAVAAFAADSRAIHAMRLYLAPFLDDLLDSSARPQMVLDIDDLESTTHRSLGLVAEAERYERLEARYLPLFDRVIACSPGDARAVANSHGLAVVEVVPNAVRLPARTAEPERCHDLLFVGNLSYEPNARAACWLCREVVPLLGDVSVALVGTRPGPEVFALADDDRVTVAADVPEVGTWYAGAGIATAPLHAGGGTRTKVLEAFAHDRAVVATTIGVEGLPIGQADGPVVVADTPVEFAAACRRLLDDPTLASALADRGKELVKASATVEIVADSIDHLFGNMLAR